MPKRKDSIQVKIDYLDQLHKAMNKIKMHIAYQHNESAIAGLRTIDGSVNGYRDEIIELQAKYNVYRRLIAERLIMDFHDLLGEIYSELGLDTDAKEVDKETELLRYKIGPHLDRKAKDKKTVARPGKKEGNPPPEDRKGPFQ